MKNRLKKKYREIAYLNMKLEGKYVAPLGCSQWRKWTQMISMVVVLKYFFPASYISQVYTISFISLFMNMDKKNIEWLVDFYYLHLNLGDNNSPHGVNQSAMNHAL